MGDNDRDSSAFLRSAAGVVMYVRQLRGWLVRLFGLFHRKEREREFAEELESHLAFHIVDNLRAGLLIRTMNNLSKVQAGYNNGKILTMSFTALQRDNR